jgi:type II secretory pathway pseudopilin PulG
MDNLTTIIALVVIAVVLYVWVMRKRYAESFKSEMARTQAERRARREEAARLRDDDF